MLECDVLIAGGGPAGSACAWKLRQEGLDVIVVDRATFPRDKVCAGWITPQVIADLVFDADEYRQGGRTFQTITGFRVGTIGGHRDVVTEYHRAVSYGIRRCEFDAYLLQRSGASVRPGSPITSLRRDGARWIVNEILAAPMIVGAGGHFCPVARVLNPSIDRRDPGPLVAAQEVEFAVDLDEEAAFTTSPSTPELYFCRDFKGYGWCFRKGRYLNVGFGSLDRHAVPAATSEFVAFLVARGIVPLRAPWQWHGHAYRVHDARRCVVDDGVLLVGDAAGLAYPQSGEGIRPAIESGLIAAATLIEAGGCYRRKQLQPYVERLRARFGIGRTSDAETQIVPARFTAWLAGSLFRTPAFVRHIVLDRWFLRAHEPALTLP